MPDYSLGKIYKIVGNGKVYVGSTTRPLLSQRLAKHRCDYKCWENGSEYKLTSYECISDPECYIELLELCPCSSVDELRKCEGKWIRDLDCVNRKIEGRTKSEWAYENKEEIAKRKKELYEANIDHIKKYREDNKERISEYNKKYQKELRLKKKEEK